MTSFNFLFSRDNDGEDTGLAPSTVNLLIAFLALALVGVALGAILLSIRSRRRSRMQSELPLYNGPSGKSSNHRRLTITASQNGRTESIYVYNEKRNLIENSSSPPPSPIPEIRITFPEEEDEVGKRKSGRVVVVRIGETGGIGLEPYHEDLPPYQTHESGRFQSLDLERMGGLKEKDDRRYS